MVTDQSIQEKQGKLHMAIDDPILTTMRFIPQHEVVQRYGAILPDYLTNPAMKESEAYKTYHDLATGKVQPKPKYVRRSSRTKSDRTPKSFLHIALTVAEQMKLAIERRKTQITSLNPCCSGHMKELVYTRVPNAESDNDDEDFVHLKFTTHDDEARQEEVNEEDSFDPRVQTPSHVESTDDDDNDDEIQGANVMGEEMDEEATNAEGEENELYRDVNVNLEGRDTTMTDALLPNVQAT
ncbi:hypothetical protein Tco_1143764 [Tanacetum coccineum]